MAMFQILQNVLPALEPAVGGKHGVQSHPAIRVERHPVVGEQRIWGVLIMGSFDHHHVHAMVHQLGHQGVKFLQGSLKHILDFRILLVMVVSRSFFVFPKRGGPDHQNVVGALCNGCCHG